MRKITERAYAIDPLMAKFLRTLVASFMAEWVMLMLSLVCCDGGRSFSSSDLDGRDDGLLVVGVGERFSDVGAALLFFLRIRRMDCRSILLPILTVLFC